MKRQYNKILVVVLLVLVGYFLIDRLQYEDQSSHVPQKFGATYMTMNNVYFEALNDSIRTVVEANGDVLITRDPLQDQEKQNDQIEEMLNEGVAAIFLNPVDWKKVKPALEKCKERGVPVFNIDSNVYDESYIVSSITSDNYEAGVQCARDMMRKVKEARIVIVSHTNINSTQLRVQGFLDTIAGHDTYQVVRQPEIIMELEYAMKEMTKILESGLAFDVVIGGNDPTALGALAALQRGRYEKAVLVYGVDGSPDGKAMIKAGYLEGSSAQSPMQVGTIAAETAYCYLDGKDIESNIIVPVTFVTRDNLDMFDIAGWQ